MKMRFWNDRTHAIRQRLIRGALWSLLGAVGSNGITLLVGVATAHILGKDQYGRVVLLQTTLGTLGVLALFGLGTVATKYVAELKTKDPVRLGGILSLSEEVTVSTAAAAAIAVSSMADWIAATIFSAPELSQPLALSALGIFFTALDGFQKAALVGLEAMREFAVSSVAAALLSVPFVLACTVAFGVMGASMGLVISAFFQAVATRLQMRRQLSAVGVEIRRKGPREWDVIREFALPSLLASALVPPAHWACQVFLTSTSRGYSELAVLGIAMQWFNLVMFLPIVGGRIVLPMLTTYVTTNDRQGARQLISLAVKSNAVVAAGLALPVALLSPWIMRAYGKDFGDGWLPLTLAVLAACLISVQAPVGNMLAAASKMWTGAAMNLGWAACYLSLAYAYRSEGAAGILGAMLGAYLIHSVWVVWWARNALRETDK